MRFLKNNLHQMHHMKREQAAVGRLAQAVASFTCKRQLLSGRTKSNSIRAVCLICLVPTSNKRSCGLGMRGRRCDDAPSSGMPLPRGPTTAHDVPSHTNSAMTRAHNSRFQPRTLHQHDPRSQHPRLRHPHRGRASHVKPRLPMCSIYHNFCMADPDIALLGIMNFETSKNLGSTLGRHTSSWEG